LSKKIEFLVTAATGVYNNIVRGTVYVLQANMFTCGKLLHFNVSSANVNLIMGMVKDKLP